MLKLMFQNLGVTLNTIMIVLESRSWSNYEGQQVRLITNYREDVSEQKITVNAKRKG